MLGDHLFGRRYHMGGLVQPIWPAAVEAFEIRGGYQRDPFRRESAGAAMRIDCERRTSGALRATSYTSEAVCGAAS